jgi:hypothetical protein
MARVAAVLLSPKPPPQWGSPGESFYQRFSFHVHAAVHGKHRTSSQNFKQIFVNNQLGLVWTKNIWNAAATFSCFRIHHTYLISLFYIIQGNVPYSQSEKASLHRNGVEKLPKSLEAAALGILDPFSKLCVPGRHGAKARNMRGRKPRERNIPETRARYSQIVPNRKVPRFCPSVKRSKRRLAPGAGWSDIEQNQ